ncbi:MAG: hypothetical protein U1E31_01385 [Rickettsiales bacterium]
MNNIQSLNQERVSEDDLFAMQPILEEIDKRLIVYSKNFQELYRKLRPLSEISSDEEYKTLGQYTILDSPTKSEESEVLTSLRKIFIKGKNFKDNYIILQLNTPDVLALHEEYILLGFNDDLTIRAPANIGEPRVCLTTINVKPKTIVKYSGEIIEDNDFHLFRRFENNRSSNKYINQTCKFIDKKKLFFIRNKTEPINNIQIITEEKSTYQLSKSLGIVKLPNLEDIKLKSVQQKLDPNANKRVDATNDDKVIKNAIKDNNQDNNSTEDNNNSTEDNKNNNTNLDTDNNSTEDNKNNNLNK